jgi:type IV secretion system protein VirB4
MLRKMRATQVFFDKDHGLEILVRAERGQYLSLHDGIPTGMNPLRLDPTPKNMEFLKAWLRQLVARVDKPFSVREETDLDLALRDVMRLDAEHRRLSRLLEYLDATDPEGMYARLSKWCTKVNGDYGWVFDNRDDVVVGILDESTMVGFDVTDFLDNEITRAPVTMYLFHLVERLVDGRRLVVWADEFSKLLSDKAFEKFSQNSLQTWRKLNGVLTFATQSPSHVLNSPIARALIEQTATKIFFPNPEGTRKDYCGGFGLTEQEYLLLTQYLEPGSRMFLIKQGHQSVVCQLDLKGFDYELNVISGRAPTVQIMNEIIADVGPDPTVWLPLFRAATAKEANLKVKPIVIDAQALAA